MNPKQSKYMKKPFIEEPWFRPKRIQFIAFDPFDNSTLSITDIPYSADKASFGFYRRYYLKLRAGLPYIFPELGIRRMGMEVRYSA